MLKKLMKQKPSVVAYQTISDVTQTGLEEEEWKTFC